MRCGGTRRIAGLRCSGGSPGTRSRWRWSPGSCCCRSSARRWPPWCITAPTASWTAPPMSQAYRSVLAISFDVRGGLLIRQVHHWSADLFVAAICLRLLRAFFRGRFSGRALPDWLIWVTLLPLGMLAAYTGTILPDDGLSGGSLGVITGVLLSRAADRDAPGVLDLRRRAARASDHRPRLLGAHPGPPGPGRRAAPGELPAVAAVAAPGAARSAAAVHLRGAGPARRDRADQPGMADTGRTSRAASAPARCRTGTWGSSTARCGSCRPGS